MLNTQRVLEELETAAKHQQGIGPKRCQQLADQLSRDLPARNPRPAPPPLPLPEKLLVTSRPVDEKGELILPRKHNR